MPSLYDEILNHPNTPDELRRRTEAKQLRRKRDHLHSLPLNDPMKRQLAIEVEKLISGAVLLRVGDELAWSAFIDGQDCETIGTEKCFSPTSYVLIELPEGYDYDILRQYLKLFPDEVLSRLIQTYLAYLGVPLSDEEETAVPSASLDNVFGIISVRFVLLVLAYSPLGFTK